jgi:hypothetical protein
MLFVHNGYLAAQELLDPTRPAVSLDSTSGVISVGSHSTAQRLSMIIIKDSQRAAIIDGRIFELGDRYGSSKVIEVNANNIVLQSAAGRRVMQLFPTVKMNILPSVKSIPEMPDEKVQSETSQTQLIANKEKK